MDFQEFDANYLELLTKGDPSTEQHFTKYFGELLFIKLRTRVCTLDEVHDIRQETFLRVLTALRLGGGMEHPERLGAFVNAFCKNILLERSRSNARSQPLDLIRDPVSAAASIESELVSEESIAEVRKVFSELPQHDQKLLERFFLDEADKDKICAEFGVDRNYLRVLVHRSVLRARKSLRNLKGDN